MWRQTGRELRTMADAFARSQERALVLEQAEQVDVTSLDREKFWELLKGLFEVNTRLPKTKCAFSTQFLQMQ